MKKRRMKRKKRALPMMKPVSQSEDKNQRESEDIERECEAVDRITHDKSQKEGKLKQNPQKKTNIFPLCLSPYPKMHGPPTSSPKKAKYHIANANGNLPRRPMRYPP